MLVCLQQSTVFNKTNCSSTFARLAVEILIYSFRSLWDLFRWPKCLTIYAVCAPSNVWCRASWCSRPKDCSTIYRGRFTSVFIWWYDLDSQITDTPSCNYYLPSNRFPFADFRRWQVSKNYLPWLHVQTGVVVWIQNKELGIAAFSERFGPFSTSNVEHGFSTLSFNPFQSCSNTMCWAMIS